MRKLAQVYLIVFTGLIALGLLVISTFSDFFDEGGTVEPSWSIVGTAVSVVLVVFLFMVGFQRDLGRLFPVAVVIFGLAIARWMWFVGFVAVRDSSLTWALKVALMTAPFFPGPPLVAMVLAILQRIEQKDETTP